MHEVMFVFLVIPIIRINLNLKQNNWKELLTFLQLWIIKNESLRGEIPMRDANYWSDERKYSSLTQNKFFLKKNSKYVFFLSTVISKSLELYVRFFLALVICFCFFIFTAIVFYRDHSTALGWWFLLSCLDSLTHTHCQLPAPIPSPFLLKSQFNLRRA